MNLHVITQEDLSILMTKLDSLERKVDALSHKGIGAKQLYTILDACTLLQASKRTLQRYRDNGVIPFSQIGGKIYFTAEDLEVFIAENKITQTNIQGGRRHEKR